ncbi:DUF5991 domain-containing protein [Mesonia maritima]|uniref:Lipoprotein n=1 Tax=Mesonia maritima TaxID=1793873 RepID=A0ABU1K899_9FLAO|nr:DUF5991 domain-containing protein [Mesonia maritima]MDR6300778.1 hypothetical protein [Mesonia maritima]
MLTFTSCEKNNLQKWKGNYLFFEEPVKALADYYQVMNWELKLDSLADEKIYGNLKINGQQTFVDIAVYGKIEGEKLSIKSLSSEDNLDKNETLFQFSYVKDSVLKTTWQKFQPKLKRSSQENCLRCFSKVN